MPDFGRIDRISEEVRKEIDRTIRYDLNDPRIKGTWAITRCDVTRDLKYCKVRVSIMETELRDDMMKALKSASGFVRRSVGKNVDIRNTPEISFELDMNVEYAARINQILKDTETKSNGDK